jgi:hypothetical protein
MSRLDLVFLDWHRRVRAQPLLYRFTLATRILLAVGFIPTGMVKVLGRRFSYMSPEYPIGAFFETLYQSGLYWHFIGAAQVGAGILVLVPATATLGAVLFFPILANVFVITLSYDFNFTPVITGQMLLASIYLLAWDYDRLRGLFVSLQGASPIAVVPKHRLTRAESCVYVVGTASGLLFFGAARFSFLAGPWYWKWFGIGLGSCVVALWLGWNQREVVETEHLCGDGVGPARRP